MGARRGTRLAFWLAFTGLPADRLGLGGRVAGERQLRREGPHRPGVRGGDRAAHHRTDHAGPARRPGTGLHRPGRAAADRAHRRLRLVAAAAEDRRLPALRPRRPHDRAAQRAARYSPVYYLPVGVPLAIWPDRTGVVAARLVSALLCALLLAGAVAAAVRVGSRLLVLGVVLAATPIALNLAGAVNPNGLEICAGILTWCALLGLVRAPQDRLEPATMRRLLISAGVGSVLLLTVRQLGPVLLALIVAGCVLAAAPGRLRWLARRRAVVTGLGGAWLAGTAAAVGWLFASRITDIRTGTRDAQPELGSAWTLTHVLTDRCVLRRPVRRAVRVRRGGHALAGPAAVVPAGGGRRGTRRGARRAPGTAPPFWLLLAGLAFLGGLDFWFLPRIGWFAQGRYGLAALVGVLLIPAGTAALDGWLDRWRLLRWAVVGAGALAGLLHGYVLARVVTRFAHGIDAPLDPLGGAWHPPLDGWLPMLAVGAGALALTLLVAATSGPYPAPPGAGSAAAHPPAEEPPASPAPDPASAGPLPRERAGIRGLTTRDRAGSCATARRGGGRGDERADSGPAQWRRVDRHPHLAPLDSTSQGGRRGAARFVTVGLVDQVVIALANAGNTLLALALLDRTRAGVMLLSLGLSYLVIGVNRAFVGEVLLTLASRYDDERRERLVRNGSAAALTVGCAAAVLCLGIGLVFDGGKVNLGDLVFAAPFLPSLLLHDTGRYTYLSARQPQRALVIDAVWVGTQLLGVLDHDRGRPDQRRRAVGLLGTRSHRRGGRVPAAQPDAAGAAVSRAWFAGDPAAVRLVHGDGADRAGLQGQVVGFLVANRLSARELSGLRGAQTAMLQPVQNFITAVMGLLVPRTSRLAARGAAGAEGRRRRPATPADPAPRAGLRRARPSCWSRWWCRWPGPVLVRIPKFADIAPFALPIALPAGALPGAVAVRGGHPGDAPGQPAVRPVPIFTTASLSGLVIGATAARLTGAAWGLTAGSAVGLAAMITCTGTLSAASARTPAAPVPA